MTVAQSNMANSWIGSQIILEGQGGKDEKRTLFNIGLLLCMTFAFVSWGAAEEPAAEAPKAEAPKTTGATLDDIKKLLGLSIYLQGGYNYNFRDPSSGENELRIFDHKANTFTVDLAQIVFNKDAEVGGIGYRLKLSAGETAKFIHAAGVGNTDDPFDLTEAYIDYIAPVGKGLKFRLGKFVHAWC